MDTVLRRPAIKYAIDTVCQSYVEGWALGPSGLCTVAVMVDGRPVGHAVTGLSRPDVGAALPEIPGSVQAGFMYAFTRRDLSQSTRDIVVSLRITADGGVLETERITIPALETARDNLVVPRSPLPATVTEVIIRRSPDLATGDLASEAGALAAVAVLEHLVQRGPRPLPGVHRYLGFLRAVYGSALFAAQYFPRVNVQPTGEKDRATITTAPMELMAIAHHLYVLADSGIPGALLEFGCYKGYSTSVLSTACHLLGRELDVFDSFQGLPSTISTYYRRGEFAGDLEEVRRNLAEFGRPDVVTFHPGFFSESVPKWAARSAACLWMDVDLEQSAIDALRAFPNLDRRGALFSHECQPVMFDGRRPTPHRGPDEVVGPIVDAFTSAGRQPVGLFLCGYTGAFWDSHEGVPVLPFESLERLVNLARG
jgi:O-methyltransferase